MALRNPLTLPITISAVSAQAAHLLRLALALALAFANASINNTIAANHGTGITGLRPAKLKKFFVQATVLLLGFSFMLIP